jgi:response regulator RpfG family c-di-GMP phosphodiesterase
MSFSNNDQRRVLLIDRDSLKQKLRAAALRNREVEVHTASDAADAGRLWREHAYDLVLIAAEENSEEAAALCSELKKSKPKQRIALLVGAPQYVRKIGRKRDETQPADARSAPPPAIGTTQTQVTQWHVMMERLLAAG